MRFLIPSSLPRLWHLLVIAGMLLALIALSLNPGAASSQSGPSVTGVALTSAPNSGNTYTLGETIRVTLSFSEAVEVTGTPRLKIDMDPAHWGQKWATNESGSGTASLTFAHEVVEPNRSTRGIAVLANTLELNGGTVQSTTGTDALLAHVGLDHDSNHKVDWLANRPATGALTIMGTAQVGETLMAGTSGISDADGLVDATFSYQWLADDADISGATGNTYTLVAADEGKAVKVRLSFTDDAGNDETLTSIATAAVAPRPNTPATGALTIMGTAQVGETLMAGTSGISDNDGLVNATFSYQWLANDADISGATRSTYTLVAADEGKAVKVRLSFTDDAGNEESLTSAATTAVAPPPLTASFENVPAQHDGKRLFSFELHFSENFPGRLNYKKLRDEAFQVENGTVRVASRVVKGENRRWTISVRPDSDEDVTVKLPATNDCAATGAVCTESGRVLSNATTVTVGGPVDASPGSPGQLGKVLVELSLRRPSQVAPAEDTLRQARGTRSASGQSEQTPQTTSIVYVVDDSGSMDGDFREVRKALRDVRDTNMDNTKVALIAFGTEPTTVFGLTDHSTHATTGPWTDASIDSFGGRLAGTEFEAPLENAKALLEADDADNKKIIFLTDAQSNVHSWFYADLNWLSMPDAVQGIKDAGITVDTVGFGDHYSYNFPRLEQIATDTGGQHRVVLRTPQGTTNDPAVTATSVSDILEGTVADNTATLFLVDYSGSLRQLWATQTDWKRHFDYTLIDGALNAAATKAAESSGKGRQVGLATFLGETTWTTTNPEGHPKYKVIHAIAAPSATSSLGMPFRYKDTLDGSVETLPGYGSTDIDHALQQAYSTISGATATNKRVVLITDGISAVDVQDSTLDSYKNNPAVTLDVVAWGDHADRVQLKMWADSASGSFSVAKTPPLAPIRFGAIDGESSTYEEGSVLVGWNDAGDPAITKHQYKWEYRDYDTGEDVESGWTDMPGTGSSANNWYVITGLDHDEPYYIAVRAVRGDTPGARSRAVTISWRTELDVKAKAGDGQIDLSWRIDMYGTALERDRKKFKEYRYSLREGEDGVWSDWTTIPGANHDHGSHTITGLTNGTTYTVAMAKLLEGIVYEELGTLSYYSASFGTATGRPNYQPTGAPTITGTVQVGETLTADTSGISDADGLDDVTFYYSWMVYQQFGDGYFSIWDAPDSASTILTTAEEGSAVKVTVYFEDDAGNWHELTSSPTAEVASTTLPHVDDVAVTSTPIENNTYGLGETIRVTLTFSEAVDVTGTPRLKVSLDSIYDYEEGSFYEEERWANYESGSGTTSLTFAYEVAEPDYGRNYIAVLRNTLELNGGTIKSTATESDAYLAHKYLMTWHEVNWRK